MYTILTDMAIIATSEFALKISQWEHALRLITPTIDILLFKGAEEEVNIVFERLSDMVLDKHLTRLNFRSNAIKMYLKGADEDA